MGKRTVREQVISGFRIAGLLLLGFAFFVGMAISSSLIVRRDGTLNLQQRWLGVIALSILAVILFYTVNRWTQWLIGILAYSFFRILAALFLGPFGRHPVPRSQAAACVVYLMAAGLLTMRHVERLPRGIEKFGLVGFLVCVPFALSLESYKPLLLGLLLLGLSELAETIRTRYHAQPSG